MPLFRFEHSTKPLAPSRVFFGRLVGSMAIALVLIGAALGIGMAGYRVTEHMDWLDAFLNAAMLLGGMGPVNVLQTEAGKLFAGLYALFCGLLIVVASGVILAPILHRVLHALHADAD